jgi:hypothetical protein
VLEFVLQVITDMDMKVIPEIFRLCRISTYENGDEQRAELRSCLYSTGLFKTLDPLPVILQKTSGKASLFE